MKAINPATILSVSIDPCVDKSGKKYFVVTIKDITGEISTMYFHKQEDAISKFKEIESKVENAIRIS